jgi:hypothetical protein
VLRALIEALDPIGHAFGETGGKPASKAHRARGLPWRSPWGNTELHRSTSALAQVKLAFLKWHAPSRCCVRVFNVGAASISAELRGWPRTPLQRFASA